MEVHTYYSRKPTSAPGEKKNHHKTAQMAQPLDLRWNSLSSRNSNLQHYPLEQLPLWVWVCVCVRMWVCVSVWVCIVPGCFLSWATSVWWDREPRNMGTLFHRGQTAFILGPVSSLAPSICPGTSALLHFALLQTSACKRDWNGQEGEREISAM